MIRKYTLHKKEEEEEEEERIKGRWIDILGRKHIFGQFQLKDFIFN